MKRLMTASLPDSMDCMDRRSWLTQTAGVLAAGACSRIASAEPSNESQINVGLITEPTAHHRINYLDALASLSGVRSVAVVDHTGSTFDDSRRRLGNRFHGDGFKDARKMLATVRPELTVFTTEGERFPEYDEWRTAEKTEKEEHQKRVKELENDPAGLMLFALEKLTGKSSAAELKQESPVSLQPHLIHPVKTESKQRVGRNELCPCGSGKKYKKCCLNKSGVNPLHN
jgi:hypothetical protein